MTNNKESTKYLSDRQELAVARATDGKRTWASGAGVFDKTDVVTNAFAIECKTAMKEKSSFAIQRAWIDKVEEQSFSAHKNHWAIAFNFGGMTNVAHNYYVISEEDFALLNRILGGEYGEN